jgi:flagellar biosynthesis GTPase FlhF
MQLSKISRPLAVAAVLVLTSTLAWAALGDKRTILKTEETIEVPGAVLPPGEYVVKLFDSQGLRHVVQVFNQDETELLSTIIAIPNRRLEPTEDTQFSWYETPAGQPPALRAWFYPGDTMGQEFAYPEDRATEIAEATQQEVPRLTEEDTAMADKAKEETTVALVAVVPVETPAESTQQQAAQQDREQETAAQQERNTQAQAQREREMQAQRERDLQAQRERDAEDQRERQIAQAPETQQRETDQSLTAQQQQDQQQDQQQQNQLQNQQRNTDQDQTTQQAQQTQTTGNELPATAGFGALLALLGLGSLGASRVVRNLRSK